MICPYCKGQHTLSQCKRWLQKFTVAGRASLEVAAARLLGLETLPVGLETCAREQQPADIPEEGQGALSLLASSRSRSDLPKGFVCGPNGGAELAGMHEGIALALVSRKQLNGTTVYGGFLDLFDAEICGGLGHVVSPGVAAKTCCSGVNVIQERAQCKTYRNTVCAARVLA
jgi:hypothetical protein